MSDDQAQEDLRFATLIGVTLLEVEPGTALRMQQSYFERMPPPEAFAGVEQGWPEQLDKLEQLLVLE